MSATVPPGIEVGVILLAYLIGCLSPGYWIVRWRTGEDIRQRFTGRTGARNAGRLTGRAGFAATFLLDFGKGALAVALARLVGLNDWGLAAAALAVVIGHNWPVQLRFQGGRGLSPALGAVLVLHPPTAIGIVLVAGAIVAVTRWANLAGLAAAAAAPFLAIVTGAAPAVIIGISALALLVLFAHRGMLHAIVQRRSGAGDAGQGVTGEASGAAPKGPPQ